MDQHSDKEQDKPLSSEALKREEWRGDGTSPDGEKRDGDAAETGRDGPNPMAGTMLPPD